VSRLALTPNAAPAQPLHALRAPIRVLTADRQPLFREALARTVRQRAGFQLVAEVADGRAALAAIERDAPDVAIVDVGLPGLDGARVLNAVIRDEVPTRILLLSNSSVGSQAYEALAAGAAGWLSKAADEGELCAAVAATARGEIALTGDAQTAVAAEIRRRATQPEPVLNDRERQVLRLVAEGWSAGEIGRELYLSTGSVKSSLLKLYKRLDVSERAAAVAVAMRRGLID
jgi:two-component system, NarL family, nitrate/nitrite response regulator NarL